MSNKVEVTLTDPGMSPNYVTIPLVCEDMTNEEKLPQVESEVLTYLRNHKSATCYTKATTKVKGRRLHWSKGVNGDPWAPGTLSQRVKKVLISWGVTEDLPRFSATIWDAEGHDIRGIAILVLKRMCRYRVEFVDGVTQGQIRITHKGKTDKGVEFTGDTWEYLHSFDSWGGYAFPNQEEV